MSDSNNLIVWNPSMTNTNPFNQSDFHRDTLHDNFSHSQPLDKQAISFRQNAADQVSNYSAISGKSSLNYHIKTQIQELTQLKTDINKKTSAHLEQQCIKFLQQSFDQVKDHVQLQTFSRMKEFVSSQEFHSYKSHTPDTQLHHLQQGISQIILEATKTMSFANDEKKESLIRDMQEIQTESIQFLEEYEPVQFSFDLESFKQDFDYLLHKYIKISFQKQASPVKQKPHPPQKYAQEHKVHTNQYVTEVDKAHEDRFLRNSQQQPLMQSNRKDISPIRNDQDEQFHRGSDIGNDQDLEYSLDQNNKYFYQHQSTEETPIDHQEHYPSGVTPHFTSQQPITHQFSNSQQQQQKHQLPQLPAQQHQQNTNYIPQQQNSMRQNTEFLGQSSQQQMNPQQQRQTQPQSPGFQQQVPQNKPLQPISPSQPQVPQQQMQQQNNVQQNQPYMPQQHQVQQQQQQITQVQQNQPQQQPVQLREFKSLIDDKGNQYQGEVLNNNIKDGKGDLRYALDGSYYRGEFKHGMRHGRGEFILPNGDKYAGEFAQDMKHGYGKIEQTSSRVVYYGQWACDKMHGMGTMSGPNNYFYNGEWKQGKQHGKGLRKYEDKSAYEGMFEAGVRSGQGKMVYKDGSVFEGQWAKDKKNGVGILSYTDGSVMRAKWVEDILQGKGELEKANGKIIIGEWKDNALVKIIEEK